MRTTALLPEPTADARQMAVAAHTVDNLLSLARVFARPVLCTAKSRTLHLLPYHIPETLNKVPVVDTLLSSTNLRQSHGDLNREAQCSRRLLHRCPHHHSNSSRMHPNDYPDTCTSLPTTAVIPLAIRSLPVPRRRHGLRRALGPPCPFRRHQPNKSRPIPLLPRLIIEGYQDILIA